MCPGVDVLKQGVQKHDLSGTSWGTDLVLKSHCELKYIMFVQFVLFESLYHLNQFLTSHWSSPAPLLLRNLELQSALLASQSSTPVVFTGQRTRTGTQVDSNRLHCDWREENITVGKSWGWRAEKSGKTSVCVGFIVSCKHANTS